MHGQWAKPRMPDGGHFESFRRDVCAYALSFGSLVFSKFHPRKKSLERAFRHRCAGMFSRALPLRLVEDDVRPTHRTVLKG